MDHFNISFDYMKNEIEYHDFFILLSVAVEMEEIEADKNELDWYARYLLAGGKANKWKWSRQSAKMRAKGKKYTNLKSENSFDQVYDSFMGLIRKQEKGLGQKRGTQEEFADSTGRPLYYLTPDNVLFNRQGLIVDGQEYRDHIAAGRVPIVVKVDREGNKW